MKHNPDDRRDNVEKIQKNIDNTKHQMEMADDMINSVDNSKTKKDLKEKNKRRSDAIDGMQEELKDEKGAQKKGYK